jgi:predicted DNA-binding transcriptional regulator AlpA
MDYLKVEEVCARYRMSERTLYRLVQKDQFPKPIKIGGQNRWPESLIAEWEAAQNGQA